MTHDLSPKLALFTVNPLLATKKLKSNLLYKGTKYKNLMQKAVDCKEHCFVIWAATATQYKLQVHGNNMIFPTISILNISSSRGKHMLLQ